MSATPKIWLPDDATAIVADTGTEGEDRITVHQERITLTLQQIGKPKGFKKDDE